MCICNFSVYTSNVTVLEIRFYLSSAITTGAVFSYLIFFISISFHYKCNYFSFLGNMSESTYTEEDIEFLNYDIDDGTTEYSDEDKENNSNFGDDDDHDEDFTLSGAKKSSNKVSKKTIFSDEKFLNLLKIHASVLLEKSQTPSISLKKRAAVKLLSEQLQLEFGLVMTESQIKKKFNNLKERAKRKADMKKTGNKKMVLKPAENMILDMLQQKDNPSITKLKCK